MAADLSCLIVGCGYVGSRLAHRESGRRPLLALVRSGRSAAGLQSAGVPALRIDLDAAQKVTVQAALVERMRASPQVAAVFTAQELAAAPSPTGSPQDWTLLERARASFDASRAGDVVLLLNVMPCVFPILSLKALSLARTGESPAQARAEGLAYAAGVVLACVALGAGLLALRSAGEEVGLSLIHI